MFGLFKAEDGKVIHVNDIDDLIGKIELIDIREPYEVAAASILTAKNIPMGNLLGNPGKYLIQGKTYYIMCQSGGRSTRACKMLKDQGYDVINVAGGMGSYMGKKRK